jgi:hypothetical protein
VLDWSPWHIEVLANAALVNRRTVALEWIGEITHWCLVPPLTVVWFY